jgi:hypothetical protein
MANWRSNKCTAAEIMAQPGHLLIQICLQTTLQNPITRQAPSQICSEIFKVLGIGLCPLCPRKRTHDENKYVGRTLGLPASPRQLRRLCAKRLTGAGLWTFCGIFGRPALPRLVNFNSTTPLPQRRTKILFSCFVNKAFFLGGATKK